MDDAAPRTGTLGSPTGTVHARVEPDHAKPHGATAATLCTCCLAWRPQLRADKAGRRRSCPGCGSLERHRLQALLLPALIRHFDAAAPGKLIVDVAPARGVDLALNRLSNPRRVRMDFDPAADRREVNVQASVMAMPFQDGAIDVLLCSHVLEHVSDDITAMAEIARVLTEGGVGLVVVPLRGTRTDEDPQASPQERIARFGQADHVRYYGRDFDDRLRAAGLQITSFTSGELLPPWLVELIRLMPGERFHLVARPGTRLPTAAELAPVVLAVLAAALPEAETEALRQARAETQRWWLAAAELKRRYRRLRGRRAVRAVTVLDRMLNRARAMRRRGPTAPGEG